MKNNYSTILLLLLLIIGFTLLLIVAGSLWAPSGNERLVKLDGIVEGIFFWLK